MEKKPAIYNGRSKSLQYRMGRDEERLSRNEHKEKNEGGTVTKRPRRHP